MERRFEVAVGCDFQQLADVDDEGVLNRISIDPPVGCQHLQSRSSRLRVQQRESAGVTVFAHALRDRVINGCGVADDLDERFGLIRKCGCEVISRLAQTLRPFAQQLVADLRQLLKPAVGDGFELRE